jgi:hypothetical protein
MEATRSVQVSNTMSDNKSKKTATKKAETPAPAPVATPVAAPVAAEKKAPRKAVAKAEVTVPTVAAPVAAPVETAAPTTQEAGDRLTASLEKLRTTHTAYSSELKEIVKEALAAVKAAQREIKDARRRKRTKKVEDMTAEERKAYEARRANNAFLKPRALSNELSHFMGLSNGSQRSQTEVTKFVSAYIKQHNCFDPSNKRRIIPDAALAKLLKVTDKDQVTYLNLQSYLKAHFLKA